MATPYMLEVFNMTLPPEGPGVIPIVVDFDGITETEIDLSQLTDSGTISYVSGVQVDTLEGTAGAVRLECNATGQRIEAAFGGITIMPLFQPNPPKIIARAVDGYTGIVRLHFTNFPVWPHGATGGGSSGSDGPTLATSSFLLDGTSQDLATAGDASRYFLLQNPTGNNPVTVNVGGGDATAEGFTVEAGGTMELSAGTASAITIAGTTTESVVVALGAA